MVEPGYYWVRWTVDEPPPCDPEVVEIDREQRVWKPGGDLPYSIDDFTVIARILPPKSA
jgi:hypothetical protein